jgi:hypothetical protein
MQRNACASPVQEMARRIATILSLEPALGSNYWNVEEDTFPWKG